MRWRLILCLCLTGLLLSPSAHGQSEPTHAGRPFVRVAQANQSYPAAGFVSGFGRAQIVGSSVHFATLSGVQVGGVFSSRGGPFETVAASGTMMPGVKLGVVHSGFACETAVGSRVVLAAGVARADGLYLFDGANADVILEPGTLLPNSGGRVANVLGEPFLARDRVAIIAWHIPPQGGVDFRGVYRVVDGGLKMVADTATSLPGEFGVPDTFSSQVGFDGGHLAFWASRGPAGEIQGMFVQEPDGALRKIAGTRDTFPDGGAMDDFISPPFVVDGAVYFFADDAADRMRLLRYERGLLTVLVRDGDPAGDGSPLQGLGQYGMAVEGAKVYFAARTAQGAGLFAIGGNALETIIAPGAVIGGMRPTAIVLQDVAGDTLVLDVSNQSSRRLVANLPSPAAPVIVSQPADQRIAAGARAELRVSALGDAPLAYSWRWSSPTGLVIRSTSDSLVIESATASDTGYYSVQVTNSWGVASSSSFLVNVEVPPVIMSHPTHVTVEVGDQLSLRVSAVGGFPITYTWLKDGFPAVNDSPAFGVFAKTAATLADAGLYRAVVSNAFGQVTSAEARVDVTPSPPNPMLSGRRFAPIVDVDTLVPGTETRFNVTGVNARFRGDGIVFVGRSAGGQSLGLFLWEEGALKHGLPPGTQLPGGLGVADAFNLVPAQPGDPLVVVGSQTNLPVGLYRWDGSGLQVIADTTMVAPDSGGARFSSFLGEVSQAGERVLFSTSVAGKPGLFLGEGSILRRILSGTQDLPFLGTNASQFTGLGFDGAAFVVSAATPRLETVALRGDLSGAFARLLTKGDPLPGTTQTISSFGRATLASGAAYLPIFDAAFVRYVLEWREGRFTSLAGPSVPVRDWGAIQQVESSEIHVVDGQALFTVRVNTINGVRRGIVAATAAGIEPLLFPAKLDGRRIGFLEVVSADANRMVVFVRFENGASALYANVAPAEESVRLSYELLPHGKLRLSIPNGFDLETAALLPGVWTILPANGSKDVEAAEASQFFRLHRRP